MYAIRSYYALASLLLLLGFLVACGGSEEDPSEEIATAEVPPEENTRAAAATSEGCPFSEDPSTTYDPGEHLLKKLEHTIITVVGVGPWQLLKATLLV